MALLTSSWNTTTSCDWKVPSTITQIDYLIVGGGGAGGNRHAGGGGAGGLHEATAVSVQNIDTLTITIGKGGAGQGDITGNPGTGGSGDTYLVVPRTGNR